jgi:hypothetical protein
MAVLTSHRIIIDLVHNPHAPIKCEPNAPPIMVQHFVNLGSAKEPRFELRQGEQPPYLLSAQENAKLARLMQNITVGAPQKPMQALDGQIVEVSIRHHGAVLSFCWHCELPAEWERVGELEAFATSFLTQAGERLPAPWRRETG